LFLVVGTWNYLAHSYTLQNILLEVEPETHLMTDIIRIANLLPDETINNMSYFIVHNLWLR